MAGITEVKHGFWLGLGIFAALAILGIAQMAVLRAVHRG